ncbi:S8 family serine peptidase [Blastochloris sulfoviridis]|uniref:S8 family serine peptidase n=1 Tax=Blastochloris sulfoviridis TaxID=50712 RepID=A0A5M6I3V6_9HYPH|nr:S8 family serine peptidase [Blastochloris sulfoviridis]KAA5602891.1 S8 family serine peptidase [Blastochloris sulfoviridis]
MSRPRIRALRHCAVVAIAVLALIGRAGVSAAQTNYERGSPFSGGSGGHSGGGNAAGVAIGIGAALAIGALIAASQSQAATRPRGDEDDWRGNVRDNPPPRPFHHTPTPPPNPPSAPSSAASPPAPRFTIARGETRFVPNEVLVEVGRGVTPAQIAAIERRLKLVRLSEESFVLAGRTIYRYRLPDGVRLPAVLAALSRERRVASAQPNYRFSTPRATFKLASSGTAAATIDPSLLYAPRALRLAEAHQMARGDRVLVAVIDSAVDPAHPELAGALAKSLDVTGTDGTAAPHSHGTGMAGALAARAQLVGVAPGASLVAITAFRPEGEGAGGTTVTVLRALDAAFAEGARVVNMSFAGPRDALLGRALAGAHERGLILVAAAGNAGPKSPPLYPAADRNVIAVTATDADDKVFDLANRGRHVTIAAPGVDVLVPGPEGAYAFTSGTSVAAAHVSGVVALMLERDPTLSADAVRAALAASARDLGRKGRDEVYGAGEADANAAVRQFDKRTASPAAPIAR